MTAAECVLDEQNRLAVAVERYHTLAELDLARSNVLEVLRLNPAKAALWQMMLSALRSRRKALEHAV